VLEAKLREGSAFPNELSGANTANSYPVVRARENSGLTQAEFAQLLGVSARTLQDWEQGRRKPSGAAQSLLLIAEKKPEVLREVFKLVRKAA
jgi:DNA-binding transcriptional regulator YiaG